MIYIFHENAGDATIRLKGEIFKYLIKVRRHEVGDVIAFRNHEQIDQLFGYKIVDIEGRSAVLELVQEIINVVEPLQYLHIGWCVIDPKSVEKVLPSLNEIGVSRISFISCDRSQKNFKIDFKRYERILEASNQQCGRTHQMKLDTFSSLKDFIDEFPDTKVFDFTDKVVGKECDFERVLIGCEGGFSPEEKKLLALHEVFRLDSPMVLRSESAVVAVASKVLL